MNQSFIIYVIQNMLLISLFTLVLFFIGRRVPLKAGHAWRKWLWAVLAVRLLLPVIRRPGRKDTLPGRKDLPEPEREMQSYIEEFHVKMRFAAGTGMLEDLQDPDSVAWNYFFETGDVLIGGNMEMTEQGEQWFPLRYHNEYSLEDHLETLERFKGYVQGERLKTDFDRMILCVKEIREEKSVDAVILLHELLHDLDIYFLRYGTISAIGQTVGENSEEYYGVLRVYED